MTTRDELERVYREVCGPSLVYHLSDSDLADAIIARWPAQDIQQAAERFILHTLARRPMTSIELYGAMKANRMGGVEFTYLAKLKQRRLVEHVWDGGVIRYRLTAHGRKEAGL